MRLKLIGRGKLEAVAQVQPGQPVMSEDARAAIAIRTLVAADHPAAFRELVAASESLGPAVLSAVGQAPPMIVAR
jgi:hypothetical protein